jgi:CheY-like chemotaxis protein
VEDHRDSADMMARLLTMDGYEVRAAYSAAAALRAVEAEPFDVVVSDIGLPDATGYDLMSRIKDIGDM